MQEINNIKSALGQYEKILCDKETIKSTCISPELKEKIYQDLQLRSEELKRKMINQIKHLPVIIENNAVVNATENGDSLLEGSIIISGDVNYKLWKESVSVKVNFIYDRVLSYTSGKMIFHEIYEKMTNVYGIVWEQDFKEWRRENIGIPRTLDIIYNNNQYKSIFESILDSLYSDVKEYNRLAVKEIIQPLVDIYGDKSNGGCVTLKKIYQYMEDNFNIKWQRLIRKYEKENGVTIKSKSELLYWNHGLIERFRESVCAIMEEEKK